MKEIKKQEKSLGEMLLQAGLVNKDQLNEALAEQVGTNEPIGKILVRKKFVTEEMIINILQGMLVVVCTVNEEMFGIEVVYAKEILKYKKITHLPSLPEYVLGMLNLRDEVIPVVSLNKRVFGKEDRITEESRIIVMELKDERIGVLMDSVIAVKNFTSDSFENIDRYSMKVEKKFIAGILKDGETLVTLVKPDSLIGEE